MKSITRITRNIFIGILINIHSFAAESPVVEEPPRLPPQTINILAVGDIMVGTDYPNNSRLPPQNEENIFTHIQEILKGGDITFGNLEGTLLDGGKSAKNCNGSSNCYAFRTPTRFIKYFFEAGFNLMSIANNHIGDFGENGIVSTIKTLESVGIAYAGLENIAPHTILEVKNSRVGFIAFAPNRGTLSLIDIEKAEELVRELKKNSDIVIVSFHGGAEGEEHQRVPKKTETFLGENRGDVFKFSHAMIDAGADLILGHGPHVPRAIELYQNRLIAYSLGNFATYGSFNLNTPRNLAPLLEANVDPQTGEFLGGRIYSVKLEGKGVPTQDPNQSVLKLIKNLTQLDFPNTPLLIEEDGSLYPIPESPLL